MQQLRGQLTDRIKAKSMKLLGYEIDTVGLRLMPYIMYSMQNDHKLDGSKMNNDDIAWFQRWVQEGFIIATPIEIKVTKKFWRILCEIIYLGYVDLSEIERPELPF